jgi:uncharacterized protein YjiS (DUF1127 family)
MVAPSNEKGVSIMQTRTTIAARAADRLPLAFRLAAAWGAIIRRRRVRRTQRALEELSDRTLHDIGLSRSEISSVARECGARGLRARPHFPRYY